MRHWCVCLILVAGCLTATVAGSQAPAADDGLDVLRAYLDGLETITADFRQQIVDRDLEPIDDSSGRVILKKPGRFRWDYREPYERVISADGERVWLYEVDLEQVTIRRLDAGLGETPAALLTGAADVLDHFDYRGSEVDGEIRWLRLEPRAAESDFSGIELGFAGDDLRRIFLNDRLGQRTQIFLSNVDTATAVTDEFFVFQVPEGVDVIDADNL